MMGWTCSSDGDDKTFLENIGGNCMEFDTWKTEVEMGGNIKTEVRETGC